MKQDKTIGKLVIDLDKWQTQTERARQKGCSVEYISKLIRQGKLESWTIPELGGIRLVRK